MAATRSPVIFGDVVACPLLISAVTISLLSFAIDEVSSVRKKLRFRCVYLCGGCEYVVVLMCVSPLTYGIAVSTNKGVNHVFYQCLWIDL